MSEETTVRLTLTERELDVAMRNLQQARDERDREKALRENIEQELHRTREEFIEVGKVGRWKKGEKGEEGEMGKRRNGEVAFFPLFLGKK
jgi:hypothetical protein